MTDIVRWDMYRVACACAELKDKGIGDTGWILIVDSCRITSESRGDTCSSTNTHHPSAQHIRAQRGESIDEYDERQVKHVNMSTDATMDRLGYRSGPSLDHCRRMRCM